MTLTDTLSALPAELRAADHQARYAEARPRHAVLLEHETPGALFESLASSALRCNDTGESLARALLAEQQVAPSALWTSLLLILCAPMLCALRASIRGNALDPDDLDALVLGHFLEVAQAHDVAATKRGHTLVALRSKTRRAVFREVKLEQREQVDAPATDPHLLSELLDAEAGALGYRDGADSSDPGLHGVRNQMRQVAFLREHCGDELEDEQLDLVLHTQVRRGRLCDYVDEHYPNLTPDERTRAYERLKRQHGRSLEVIREALAHLRHPRPVEDLDEAGDLEGCG